MRHANRERAARRGRLIPLLATILLLGLGLGSLGLASFGLGRMDRASAATVPGAGSAPDARAATARAGERPSEGDEQLTFIIRAESSPTVVPTVAPSSSPVSDEVTGPGQSVAMPSPLCARTIACHYAERNFLPDGYRVQMLEICGANCTTQYWVSTLGDGQQLLATEPVRGGGLLTVARPSPSEPRPAVRAILPHYAPGDPACCPSGYQDLTYTWDAATNTLTAIDPAIVPASEFEGWDALRERLAGEGFVPAFP